MIIHTRLTDYQAYQAQAQVTNLLRDFQRSISNQTPAAKITAERIEEAQVYMDALFGIEARDPHAKLRQQPEAPTQPLPTPSSRPTMGDQLPKPQSTRRPHRRRT